MSKFLGNTKSKHTNHAGQDTNTHLSDKKFATSHPWQKAGHTDKDKAAKKFKEEYEDWKGLDDAPGNNHERKNVKQKNWGNR